MKRLLMLSFALLLGLTFASAQESRGIRFESGSLSEILAKAKKENKLVFMDVYASWCGPCKIMATQVFTQKKVGDYFNKTFVNAKFDAEKGEGVQIARRYGVEAYPTFLLLDGNGTLVGKMVGGSPANDFIQKIEGLRQKALQTE